MGQIEDEQLQQTIQQPPQKDILSMQNQQNQNISQPPPIDIIYPQIKLEKYKNIDDPLSQPPSLNQLMNKSTVQVPQAPQINHKSPNMPPPLNLLMNQSALQAPQAPQLNLQSSNIPPPINLINSIDIKQKQQPQSDYEIPPENYQSKKVQINVIPKYKIKNTLWHFLEEDLNKDKKYKSVKINYDLLCKKFCKKLDKEKESHLNKDQKKQQKQKIEQIYITDAKRAGNVSIVMSSFQLSQEKLIQGIININGDINSEVLDKIITIFPNEEEKKKFLSFNGEKNKIIDSEKFMNSLISIPRGKQRINSLQFKLNFEAEYIEVFQAAKIYTEPFIILIEDVRFKLLLQAIIKITNYLNHGSNKAQAQGMTLDSFNYFDVIKSFDKDMNLLTYLSKIIYESEPKISTLFSDFLNCREAINIDVKYLENKKNEFIINVEKIEKEITIQYNLQDQENSNDNKQIYQTYQKIFVPFCTAVRSKIVKLKSKIEEAFTLTKMVGQMYGEKENYNPQQFLQNLYDFFKKIREEYQQIEFKYLEQTDCNIQNKKLNLNNNDNKFKQSHNVKLSQIDKSQANKEFLQQNEKPRMSMTAILSMKQMKKGLQQLKNQEAKILGNTQNQQQTPINKQLQQINSRPKSKNGVVLLQNLIANNKN